MTRAGRSGKAQIETEHTHYVVEIPAQIPSGDEWEELVKEWWWKFLKNKKCRNDDFFNKGGIEETGKASGS